jgi:NAD dependent epimerase/dehydratase family enzyme
MDIDLRIEKDRDITNALASGPAIWLHLLKKAVEDIAGQIEDEAKREAPVRDTGELAAHPTDRGQMREIQSRVGGKFVSGKNIVIPITVADVPKYAKWVHDGTGIYGPRNTPIVPKKKKFMSFDSLGTHWLLRSVRGQKPNPFLYRAAEQVNVYYVPGRLQYLARQIDFLT